MKEGGVGCSSGGSHPIRRSTISSRLWRLTAGSTGMARGLELVGTPGSTRYAEAVRGCPRDLGLKDAVRMSGGLDDAALGSCYRHADVFVSASVHEGFCVPVVEAMHHGVPVVALASAAVPETVGDGGVLVESADPGVLASAVHRVLEDQCSVNVSSVPAGTRAGQLGSREFPCQDAQDPGAVDRGSWPLGDPAAP